MHISYDRTFQKTFAKQSAPVQDKFEERLVLFMQTPRHPLLHVHPPHGEWSGCKSINITGDIRAIFEEISTNHLKFIAIGTHSELYS